LLQVFIPQFHESQCHPADLTEPSKKNKKNCKNETADNIYKYSTMYIVKIIHPMNTLLHSIYSF